MSFRFPETNLSDVATPFRLQMPTNAGAKPVNTAFVFTAFIRTPHEFPTDNQRNLFSRNTGANGGNDCAFGFVLRAGTLSARLANASVVLATSAGAPNPIVPLKNRNHLVGLICVETGTWMFACEPGGAPMLQALTVTAPGPYGSNFSGGGAAGVFDKIGTPPTPAALSWFGPIEETCFWHGAFPLVSGAPDPALIAALANGSQDLSTLAGLLAGGSARFRYRLRDETDLADAAGVTAPLTIVNENRPAIRMGFSSGPLRPSGLAPNWSLDAVSQVTFATAGDAATATATIATEGGTYAGITPARIEARLLNEAGGVARDWTVVDAAPAAGLWAANASAFAGVPMQAGFLEVEFRAVTGGGTVLASSYGYGLRGAGFSVLTCGQSQLMYYFDVGAGLALPAGTRGIVTKQLGNAARAVPFLTVASETVLHYMIGSALGRWARGVRQAILEINALFPGVPVQIASVGHSGEGISAFYPTGPFAQRWAAYRANLGVTQPYFLGLMGHSSGSGSDYAVRLGLLADYARSTVGVPIKTLHFETPRYWNAPTTDTPIHEAQWSRHGQRKYCQDNQADNLWMGSWASVASVGDVTNGVTVDVHPHDSAVGQGRGGGMIGWAMMSAARAVPDVPVGITAVRAVGATAVIEFGTVN